MLVNALGWFKTIIKAVFLFVVVVIIMLLLSIPISRWFEPTLKVTPAISGHYLITNANIVDSLNNRIFSTMAIEINSGVIQSVLPSDQLDAAVDQRVPRVDAQGKYLLPGLVDAHVHVFDPQDLGLYLSHGITQVRNMAGLPAHLRWQALEQADELIGSELTVFSPALNAGDDLGPFHIRVESAEDARELVRAMADKNYQGIKVYNGLDLSMTHAIFDEAKRLGLPVAGHPSSAYPFDKALELPFQSIEHIEELFQVALEYKVTHERIDQLSQALARSKTTIVSTLVAFDNIHQASQAPNEFLSTVDWNYLTGFTAFIGEKQLSPQLSGTDGQWESTKMRALNAITQSLFKNDVTMVIGSDTGPALTQPGLSFHRELALLESLNIERHKILTAATTNAVNLLSNGMHSGQIAIGQRANLILVHTNPLESLATLQEPEAVITRGRYLNREQLMSLRKQGTNHHNSYVVIGWLLESLFTQ